MSINVLRESHEPHITGSVTDVSTKYRMDFRDFARGWGAATLCDGTIINPVWSLPTIGMKYIQFYDIPGLIGTQYDDVVLTDITTEKTGGRTQEFFDFSGWDLDKSIDVVFTWTNSGRKDIIVPGDQSSLQIDTKVSLDLVQTDWIVDADTGVATSATIRFFWAYNPEIILEDEDDSTKDINYGPYRLPDGLTSPADDEEIHSLQRRYREVNEKFPYETYVSKTIVEITGYSKYNLSFGLSEYLDTINDRDFLMTPYEKREIRLQSKNRQPTDAGNDLIALDDTAKWRFASHEKEEFGIDGYKYKLTFEYNKNRWDRLVKQCAWMDSEAIDAITINDYPKIDFYTLLMSPLFNTGI